MLHVLLLTRDSLLMIVGFNTVFSRFTDPRNSSYVSVFTLGQCLGN